jgi:predicted nuclease of restriction endonuclease-like (RecB) superfamily
MSDIAPNNYVNIIARLKEKIRQAKTKASLAVNKELLNVYWEIGNTILEQQKSEGWGAKVIDRLAQDLKHEFPDMQGLSIRNIKYMRAFAEAYPEFSIVQPTLAQLQLTENLKNTFMQQVVAQIHNIYHKLFKNKQVLDALN